MNVSNIKTQLVRPRPKYISVVILNALCVGPNFFHGIALRIPQVDGTLVPILTPHVDAHVFICRKGNAAVNCQVVCDHQGIILDVVAR